MKTPDRGAEPWRWHTTPPPEEWRREGACHNKPLLTSSLFFPEGETDRGPCSPEVQAAMNAAKLICSGCSVKDECFEYAMKTNQPFGIWGGTQGSERRKMRKAWVRRRRIEGQVRTTQRRENA